MHTLHDSSFRLPDSVLEAIQSLIDSAKGSDLPIVDVSESAAKLAATLPEAAALGLDRLRDAIAYAASKDSRIGLSIDNAA